jgi:hypothetical protein
MPDYSITRFDGAFNRANGPSYKNRYQVMITVPPSVPYISSMEELNIFCDIANWPGHRIVTGELSTTAQPIRTPNSFTTEEISFTFHLNGDYKILDLFTVWMENIVNSFTYELAYKKDIVASSWEVWQLDKNNEKLKGIQLFNVFPVQTDPIDFGNGSTNEIQKLGVTVVYDRRKILGTPASTTTEQSTSQNSSNFGSITSIPPSVVSMRNIVSSGIQNNGSNSTPTIQTPPFNPGASSSSSSVQIQIPTTILQSGSSAESIKQILSIPIPIIMGDTQNEIDDLFI